MSDERQLAVHSIRTALEPFLDAAREDRELKKQELNHTKELILKEMEDEAEERRLSYAVQRIKVMWGGVIILALLGLAMVSVMYGKETIALQIITHLGMGIGGGIGGYGLAVAKMKKADG